MYVLFSAGDLHLRMVYKPFSARLPLSPAAPSAEPNGATLAGSMIAPSASGISHGALMIDVVAARGLEGLSKGRPLDTYAVVKCGKKRHVTPVMLQQVGRHQQQRKLGF